MNNKQTMTLGPLAIGTIQPGEQQADRLDELTKMMNSDTYFTGTADSIPYLCIDGRTDPDMDSLTGPNTAGGSESFMVADDLTLKRFADSYDASTAAAYRNVLSYLKDHKQPVGGHSDDHSQFVETASGCGANDKLHLIYQFIFDHGDAIKAFLEQLAIQVDTAVHANIQRNAQARISAGTFSDGATLLEELRTYDDAIIPTLQGDHHEVVTVINTQPHTTVDRIALQDEFGDMYEVFNVDVWSFDEAASLMTENQADHTAIKIAFLYYNIATAYVLGGPELRVVVR